MSEERTYTAFAGDERIVSGDLATMLRATKRYMSEAGTVRGPEAIVILSDDTGRPIDVDVRGSVEEVLDRNLPPPPRRGPGRPRLGVVSREVSLLPRHWEWLNDQPGGASAALRRLVDEARRNEGPAERARRAAAVTGRAMTVLAGDRPNYEEAYRVLDAGDRERFEALTRAWPADVRAYLLRLAEDAFAA